MHYMYIGLINDKVLKVEKFVTCNVPVIITKCHPMKTDSFIVTLIQNIHAKRQHKEITASQMPWFFSIAVGKQPVV